MAIVLILTIYLAFMYFGTGGRNEYYIIQGKDKMFRVRKKYWCAPFLVIYVGGAYRDFETADAIMRQYNNRS